MQDPFAPPSPIAVPVPDKGPFRHFCSHPECKAWDAFGHATKGGESVWFCREHDPCGGRGSNGTAGR